MLGVSAHYLDEQLRVETVLLGLRPMYGAVAIAGELLTVMIEFKIRDRVGYFIADNAFNNDTALREIAKEIDLDPLRQGIRCSTHILNLVPKAIQYGTDSNCVADAARLASKFDSNGSGGVLTNPSNPVRSRNDSASLAAWRREGRWAGVIILCTMSKGRLDGVVTLSTSSTRSATVVYQLVANGGIRCNSDFEMI